MLYSEERIPKYVDSTNIFLLISKIASRALI